MPKSSLLPALFLLAGATGLEAQTDYYARVGVIGASKLMQDVIVNEISVRQSLAPMIALGASVPIGTGYRAGAEATFASGSFLQGGPTKFIAGLGLDYRYPVMTKWDLMASARYDYHRFTTEELESRGFSQTQPVSRASLSVGLARGMR
jgi:hypothetical protein